MEEEGGKKKRYREVSRVSNIQNKTPPPRLSFVFEALVRLVMYLRSEEGPGPERFFDRSSLVNLWKTRGLEFFKTPTRETRDL